MKIRNRSFMPAMLILFGMILFSTGSLSAATPTAKNSFESPDFAFPKTVSANAQVELSRARASGNDVNLVKALIQLTVADNSVSNENMPARLQAIEDEASSHKGVCGRILYLLEAKLLAGVYGANAYVYNNRVLPLDSFPSDPTLWSRDLFAMRINGLVEKALGNPQELMNEDYGMWSSVFTPLSDLSAHFYPNLYAVMSRIGVDVLRNFASADRVIPFTPGVGNGNPGELCAALRMSVIRENEKSARAADNVAWLSCWVSEETEEFSDPQKRFDNLVDLYKEYAASPYAGELLLAAAQVDLDGREYQNILDVLVQQAIDHHPDYARVNALRNLHDSLNQPIARFQLPGQVIPGKEFTVSVQAERRTEPLYLHIYKVDNGRADLNYYLRSGQGRLAAALPVTADTCELKTELSQPGNYAAVFAFSPDAHKGLILNAYPVSFSASSLQAYYSCGAETYEDARLYILAASDGSPLGNVQVTLTREAYNKPTLTTRHTTNSEGWIAVPAPPANYRNCTYEARVGNDTFKNSIYQTISTPSKANPAVRIFPSLAIYKPGAECEFALIAYENGGETPRLLTEYPLEVRLMNASGQSVDTLKLTTDDNGRVAGKFILPKEGMMGQFALIAYDRERNRQLGYSPVQVEEYRQPGFFVELKSDEAYYTIGDSIQLSGLAKSYSGMPMGDAKVTLTVTYMQPWWRRYSTTGSYCAETTTDSNGSFHLSLPTDNLKNTAYAEGTFEVSASVTSQAGETCSSEPTHFSLGNLAQVMITGPLTMEVNGKDVEFTVQTAGLAAGSRLVYELHDCSGHEVSSGQFPEAGLYLPSAQLPSGRYKLEVGVEGNPKAVDTADIILWRRTDDHPPVETPLWVPLTAYTAPNSGDVDIIFGSTAADQTILVTVSNQNRILSRETLRISDTLRHMRVKAPEENQRIYIDLFAVNEAAPYHKTITVNPPAKELTMKVVSFRDKLLAGGKERWIFSYDYNKEAAAGLPVIATLSDKSLDALLPFKWSWPQYSSYRTGMRSSFRSTGLMGNTYNLKDYVPSTYPAIDIPDFYTWGRQLYPVIHIRGTRKMYAAANAQPQAAPMVVEEAEVEMAAMATGASAVKADMAEARIEEGAVDSVTEGESEQLRPVEMPLAWFMPMITADRQGRVEVSFDVPDYNTTWKLQLLGYTRNLTGCVSELSAVASKPVMVKSNAPRFLRTGDVAVLTATIFNNTDAPASPVPEIVIFNPLTEKVIERREFEALPVDSMGQRVVSLSFSVPSDVEFVGFKVMARTGNFSDGEQSLIRILPSSSPVIESYPFYLASGTADYSMRLPEIKEGSVTLQYCDNPVWYCVTALPPLALEKDASVLSLSNGLYARSVAACLSGRYPRIRQAVELWNETCDSTLVSPLERNPELKAVALSSTPWVSDAAAETLRMQQLSEFISSAPESSAGAMKELIARQNPDGGWSWCEGMKSSEFITRRILSDFGLLRSLGALPAEDRVNRAVASAIAYCENEIAVDALKSSSYSAEGLLDWFYLRSFFPEVKSGNAHGVSMESLKRSCLKKVKANWKHYDIAQAATAAILLNREGSPMEARTIVESLRQHGSESAEKGMWFDNLSGGYGALSTLLTTVRVLDAFREITPDSPCIEHMLQWLVIERQARDWGDNASAAQVVASVLTGAPQWTEPSDPARIFLNDKLLQADRLDALTGAFTMPLAIGDASGALLSISREASSPAWGGLITRYIAPISEVKNFSEGDVSVTKRLLLVEEDESGIHTRQIDAPVRSGDKVRVQLIVTSSRYLDYVVITDEQCGCLMPVDRLSGYKYGGETGYYREVRTGVTNLFIPRLPKGKFIIEYDCFAEGDGTYASGIATLQSLYAPSVSAHSAGDSVVIK